GLALALVGALVEEDAQRRFGLAGPDITPFDVSHRQDVQTVERHVAVVPLPDVVGQHAAADVVGRRLRELAWTWDIAATDIEPVTRDVPLENGYHGMALPSASQATHRVGLATDKRVLVRSSSS